MVLLHAALEMGEKRGWVCWV